MIPRGHGCKLTRLMDKAAMALVYANTVEEAARCAGVHPATLYRWQKIPEFRKACDAARKQLYERLIDDRANEVIQDIRNRRQGNPALTH